MKISEAWTISRAAAEVGISRTTLRSAIMAEHIPHETLATGEIVVKIDDVRKYKESPPAMGRRPAPKDTNDRKTSRTQRTRRKAARS